MNCAIVKGYLIKDPSLTETEFNGKKIPVVNFTLKVNGKRGNKKPELIKCVAWDSGAQAIAKYFIKGDSLLVKGRLQSSSYKISDTKSIATLRLRVEEFEKITQRNSNASYENG